MKSTNHRRVPVALVSIATRATTYWAGGRISSVNWNLTPIFLLMRKDLQTARSFIERMGTAGDFSNLRLKTWVEAEEGLGKGVDHTAMFKFLRDKS